MIIISKLNLYLKQQLQHSRSDVNKSSLNLLLADFLISLLSTLWCKRDGLSGDQQTASPFAKTYKMRIGFSRPLSSWSLTRRLIANPSCKMKKRSVHAALCTNRTVHGAHLVHSALAREHCIWCMVQGARPRDLLLCARKFKSRTKPQPQRSRLDNGYLSTHLDTRSKCD